MNQSQNKQFHIHCRYDSEHLFAALCKLAHSTSFQEKKLQFVSYDPNQKQIKFQYNEKDILQITIHSKTDTTCSLYLNIQSEQAEEVKEIFLNLLQQNKQQIEAWYKQPTTPQKKENAFQSWLLKNHMLVILLKITSLAILIVGFQFSYQIAKIPIYVNNLFSQKYLGFEFSFSYFLPIFFIFFCFSLLFYSLGQLLKLSYQKKELLETIQKKQEENPTNTIEL